VLKVATSAMSGFARRPPPPPPLHRGAQPLPWEHSDRHRVRARCSSATCSRQDRRVRRDAGAVSPSWRVTGRAAATRGPSGVVHAGLLGGADCASASRRSIAVLADVSAPWPARGALATTSRTAEGALCSGPSDPDFDAVSTPSPRSAAAAPADGTPPWPRSWKAVRQEGFPAPEPLHARFDGEVIDETSSGLPPSRSLKAPSSALSRVREALRFAADRIGATTSASGPADARWTDEAWASSGLALDAPGQRRGLRSRRRARLPLLRC
jgi:hypothetical protein